MRPSDKRKRKNKKKLKPAPPQEATEPIGRRRFLKVGAGAVVLGLIEYAFGPLRWAARQVWKPRSELALIFGAHTYKEDFEEIEDVLKAALKGATHFHMEAVTNIGIFRLKGFPLKRYHPLERESQNNFFSALSAGAETYADVLNDIPDAPLVAELKLLPKHDAFWGRIYPLFYGSNISIVLEDHPYEQAERCVKRARMRDEQIEIIERWMKTGKPEGAKKLIEKMRAYIELDERLNRERDERVVAQIVELAKMPGAKIVVFRGTNHAYIFEKLKGRVNISSRFEAKSRTGNMDKISIRRWQGNPYPEKQETELIMRSICMDILFRKNVKTMGGYKATLKAIADSKTVDLTRYFYEEDIQEIFPQDYGTLLSGGTLLPEEDRK